MAPQAGEGGRERTVRARGQREEDVGGGGGVRYKHNSDNRGVWIINDPRVRGL